MEKKLRQSTAAQPRMLGPFVNSTTFLPATGLTIANTDVKISKVGGIGVDKDVAGGGGTHRNNGMYSFTFNAADTDLVGEFEVSILIAGNFVVTATFWVDEEAVYDAEHGPGATASTTANLRLLEVQGSTFVEATHALDKFSTAANVVNLIWDELLAGHVIPNSGGKTLSDILASLLAGVDLLSILGQPLTETTPNRLADVFSFFYDNNDVPAIKTFNDVGSSVTFGPANFFSTARTLTTATEVGTHTNTAEVDGVLWAVTATAADAVEYATLTFTLSPITAVANTLNLVIATRTGGMRFIDISVEDKLNPGTFESLDTFGNTNGDLKITNVLLLPRHTDAANGEVTLRFGSTDFNIGDSFELDYATILAPTDNGEIPNAQENAIATAALLRSLQGEASWVGNHLLETFVKSVTSPTVVILDDGPTTPNILERHFITFENSANEISSALIIAYNSATFECTLLEAPTFTLTAGDDVVVSISAPHIVAGFYGDTNSIPVQTTDKTAANIVSVFDNNDTVSGMFIDDANLTSRGISAGSPVAAPSAASAIAGTWGDKILFGALSRVENELDVLGNSFKIKDGAGVDVYTQVTTDTAVTKSVAPPVDAP